METLFVLFRVLAIGVGAGITQAVGGQRLSGAAHGADGPGASTWAGAFVAGWMLLANEWTLDVLNAPLGREPAGGALPAGPGCWRWCWKRTT